MVGEVLTPAEDGRGTLHATLVAKGDERRVALWVTRGPNAAARDRERHVFGRFGQRTPVYRGSARWAVCREASAALLPWLFDYAMHFRIAMAVEPESAVVRAWLPGGRQTGSPGDPVTVRPFHLPALVVALPTLAVPLLSLADAGGGFRPSRGLAWLSQAARLAAALWVRGDALPYGEGRELDSVATVQWLALLDDAGVRRRLAELAANAPLEVLAAMAPGKGGGPDAERSQTTRFLVEAFVDALARLPARRGGRPRRPARTRRWRLAPRQAEAWKFVAHGLVSLPADDLFITPAMAAVINRLERWAQPALRAREAGLLQLAFELLPPPAFEAAASLTPGEAPQAEEDAGGLSLPDPLDDEAMQWRLRPCVRNLDGDATLVPLDRLEQGGATGSDLDRLGGSVSNPLEFAVREMVRAAPLLPPLRRPGAPRAGVFGPLDLTSADVARLLQEWGPRLTERGFGLVAPAWLGRAAQRVRVQLRPRRERSQTGPGLGHLGLDAVTDLTAIVELAGRPLSATEVATLAARGEGVMPLGDAVVEVDAASLRLLTRVLELWRRAGEDGALRVGDVLALAAEDPDGAASDAAEAGAAATAALRELLAAMRAGGPRLEGLDEPPIAGAPVASALYPYQRDGARWLWALTARGVGALLADDMGLGKTVQTIALLEGRRASGWLGAASASDAHDRRPVLLVCPTSVVGNWSREIARFAPDLVTHVHHGGGRKRDAHGLAEVAGQADVIVTSYTLLWRDREALAAIPWDGVVLDEAQMVKNAATQAHRAARGLDCRFRVALTGTPVENRIEDLWAIFHFLNPGYLGTQETFRRRFALPVQVERDQSRAAALHRLVAPLILRRVKTDPMVVRDLPPKVEITEPCLLTPEQARLYRAVVERLMRELAGADGMRRRALIAVAMLRLKQILNHPAQYLDEAGVIAPERSGKVTRILEIVEEALAEGDRLLLYSQFTAFGERMRPLLGRLCGEDVPYLRGATARTDRDAMVARFQAGEGSPVLLLSLRAGGVGLNLTGASRVVHMDRWWNPAVEAQATDRAYRIGQTARVLVHKMVTTGTLEERIDRMLTEKTRLAEMVVGGGEGWLTELADDALFDLIALRREALEG